MDEATANIQYVDQTGDVGGSWYYEVAAWNEAYGAEGRIERSADSLTGGAAWLSLRVID